MELVSRSTSPHPNALQGVQDTASAKPKSHLTLVKTNPSCDVGDRSFVDEVWLPDYVQSSLKGKESLRYHPKQEVRDHEYIRINPALASGRKHYALIFDIDCDNGVAAFLELLEDTGIHFSMLVGLPFTDAEISANLDRGGFGQLGLKRLHATILLKYGVRENNRRANYLMNVVHSHICDRLRQYGAVVDPGQKVSTKNPESPKWAVISGAREKTTLYELAERLELDPSEFKTVPREYRPHLSLKRKSAQEDADATGRNCGAWEACRWIAYQNWSSFPTEERFLDYMILQVEQHDSFHNAGNRMPISECRSIAKSITRWTWKHKPDPANYKRRGAAREYISPDDPTTRRQAVGAVYTNANQIRTNAKKIWEAKKMMASDGLTPTKKGVARIAGLSPNTVRTYWDGHPSTSRQRLEDLRQGVNVPLPSDPQNPAEHERPEGFKMVQSEIGPIKTSMGDTSATYDRGECHDGEVYEENQPDDTGILRGSGTHMPLAMLSTQKHREDMISLEAGISPNRDAEGNVIRRDHTDPPF